MVTEEGVLDRKAVLTAPFTLEGDESDSQYRAPNIVKRILSLFSNVRLGSDLTRLQLPPHFNIPKSQLQCYGESLYCTRSDLLHKCANEDTALKRFVSVVGWSISTQRPFRFGTAPYNPILGETHHVSRGTLNVLLEQVSHHPPVTALHATDKKENIELIWCQYCIPKFYGTHVETEVLGYRQLKLLNRNETYTMNSPNLVIKFLPMVGVDWLGNVSIRCEETGLEAELSYRGNTFWPRPSVHRSVKGKISLSSTGETIYEINGHWDRTVTATDVSSGNMTVIYDAKEALSGLETPIVKEPKAVLESESAVVWGEVNEAILEKKWEKAKEVKTRIEERQRQLQRERRSKEEDKAWAPMYFTLSYNKPTGWKCMPVNTVVPPAPIIVLHD